MYAIVSIAGQQFKVEKGKKVFVHRLAGDIGDEVSFDQVLLISQDDKTNIGTPYLPDAVVLAQILSHNRGDKVLVFKKKRRKGYQKLNGHRQDFTQILIEDISESGAPKSTEKKKSAPKQEATITETAAVVSEKAPVVKAPVKKPAAKATTEAEPKKAAAKKAAEPKAKPAAKKAAEPKAKPAAKKAPAKGKGDSKTK
jgi:large subunit ribosomal protein L21